jgi:hypothetical protein
VEKSSHHVARISTSTHSCRTLQRQS